MLPEKLNIFNFIHVASDASFTPFEALQTLRTASRCATSRHTRLSICMAAAFIAAFIACHRAIYIFSVELVLKYIAFSVNTLIFVKYIMIQKT